MNKFRAELFDMKKIAPIHLHHYYFFIGKQKYGWKNGQEETYCFHKFKFLFFIDFLQLNHIIKRCLIKGLFFSL